MQISEGYLKRRKERNDIIYYDCYIQQISGKSHD
jgi:hypothetical protein